MGLQTGCYCCHPSHFNQNIIYIILLLNFQSNYITLNYILNKYMTHCTPPCGFHDPPQPTPPLHDTPTSPLHDPPYTIQPLHDPAHPYMTTPPPHDTAPHPTPTHTTCGTFLGTKEPFFMGSFTMLLSSFW